FLKSQDLIAGFSRLSLSEKTNFFIRSAVFEPHAPLNGWLEAHLKVLTGKLDAAKLDSILRILNNHSHFYRDSRKAGLLASMLVELGTPGKLSATQKTDLLRLSKSLPIGERILILASTHE